VVLPESNPRFLTSSCVQEIGEVTFFDAILDALRLEPDPEPIPDMEWKGEFVVNDPAPTVAAVGHDPASPSASPTEAWINSSRHESRITDASFFRVASNESEASEASVRVASNESWTTALSNDDA